jgi:hypothetical protein
MWLRLFWFVALTLQATANFQPEFFAISITRGMVFADGHRCATLGWK